MAIATGARYLDHLVRFLEKNAGPLLEGSMTLKLNPVGLHFVQSRLEALQELEALISGAPVDYLRAYVSDLGDHRAIEQLRRILGLLRSLKVISVLPPSARDPTPLSLLPFGRLKVLELRGCDLSTSAARGLLELRHTLEKLICHNSTDALRHVFASRIIDIKDSPTWKKLRLVSCACNDLVLMDESLQLLSVVETLDLSRNRFAKVDNLRKCAKLQCLDLGFNHLRSISLLSEVSNQMVKLILKNNALTTLRGIENLKSLEGLDLSYNIISSFTELEILTSLSSLQNLWLEGNPICCARWYRAHVFSFFANPEKLKLDEKVISTSEYWERHIICASRQKKPAGYGFYFPAKDDPEEGGSTNAKRKKYSRLASIEDEEQGKYVHSDAGDQEAVPRDSDYLQKALPATSDMELKIFGLINRAENMKKEHSVLWLREFKEYMLVKDDDMQEKIELGELSFDHDKDKYIKVKKGQKSFRGRSEYVSDPSEGRSSSNIYTDTDTDIPGIYSSNGIVGVEPLVPNGGYASVTKSKIGRLVSGKDKMKPDLSENLSPSEIEVFLNPSSADEGGSKVEAGIRPETLTVIDEILDTHPSPTYPRSPPHYQEDILQRRLFIEEEFLQLSAEAHTAGSSDSDTSSTGGASYELSSSDSDLENSLLQGSTKLGFSEYLSASNGIESHLNQTYAKPSMREKTLLSDGHLDQQDYAGKDVLRTDGEQSCTNDMLDTGHCGDKETVSHDVGEFAKPKVKRRVGRRIISLSEVSNGDPKSRKPNGTLQILKTDLKNTYDYDLCEQAKRVGRKNTDQISSQLSGGINYIMQAGTSTLDLVDDEYIKYFFHMNVAKSGVSETCEEVVRCWCILQHESVFQEREIAILRSCKNSIYVLLIGATSDDQDIICNIMGCHRLEDLREVVIGLGLQAVRLYLKDDTTYLLLTRTAERSQDLLSLLQLCSSSASTNICYLNSWEQVQLKLLEKYVYGKLMNNIFLYSMLLLWHDSSEGESWFTRSLLVIEGYMLLCIENLIQFGSFTDDSGLSSPYYSLDSCCPIQNILEMVIDGSNICLTITISNAVAGSGFFTDKTRNVRQSAEALKVYTWKLKWYTEDSLTKFVALVKAIHLGQSSSSLPVKCIS